MTPQREPLIFPRGVRFPRKNEIPGEAEPVLRRITQAHITTGYIRNDVGGKTFGSYFGANVHAPNIFAVFNSLARGLLPEIAAPIVGIKDEEPTLGPYTYLESAISVF